MAHLTNEFFEFFMELAPNNNKDWFDIHRKRYKQHVKDPFDSLVQDVITAMQDIDPKIDVLPKNCVFRINRDIRFSKDKTPYKMNRSAVIRAGGKNQKGMPGLYFEVDCEKVRVYGGCFQPDKEQLLRIREEIAFHPKQFKKLIMNANFVKTFGEIQGDKNVRIPKELQKDAQSQELIFNKQFYWYADFNTEVALKDDFPEMLAAQYSIMKPLSDFFVRPLLG
jgi:uncharacterized protein (TIGR02453 family)